MLFFVVCDITKGSWGGVMPTVSTVCFKCKSCSKIVTLYDAFIYDDELKFSASCKSCKHESYYTVDEIRVAVEAVVAEVSKDLRYMEVDENIH